MRLIDADRLSARTCVKNCSNCDDMHNGSNVVTNCSEVRFRFLRMIEEEPTVEAIPIAWMEKWFVKALWSANDGDDITVDVMVRDWRKENETGKR